MLHITTRLIEEIQAHGVRHYPEEGVGLILGSYQDSGRIAEGLLHLKNSSHPDSRHKRYLIDAKDFLAAEDQAEQSGLNVIGVFHSHPDHPAEPSDFDLERALPNFSYIITSVLAGRAVTSRSWCLTAEGSFAEEEIQITNGINLEEA